jgi:hypothetical protein
MVPHKLVKQMACLKWLIIAKSPKEGKRMKKAGLIIILVVAIPVMADEKNKPCECQCPTLRQHTWNTVKTAWQQGKHISYDQWRAFLRWREQQQKPAAQNQAQ